MADLHADDGISYRILDSRSVHEVAQLLSQAFAARDPLAVSQSAAATSMADRLKVRGAVAARQGLSIVARDTEPSELVGVILAFDYFTTMAVASDGDTRQQPSPIGALLAELEQRYNAHRDIREGEYLHIFMIGVAEAYTGRRIAHNLVRICLENAAEHGYRRAVSEVTGPISQHILREGFGFSDQVEIVYQDFEYQGTRPFKSIQDVSSIILVDKPLVRP